MWCVLVRVVIVVGDTPWSYLDAPDLDRLDLASILVREALDTPYLVGSCLTRPDYRDVDIRVILFDERYDQLFPVLPPQRTTLLHVLQRAFTEHYVAMTGLRIDFQIQRMSDANDRYPTGNRHPLGTYENPEEARRG